jgi:leader peptidase (prepilin peptidase)/N-methyltransferase
MIAGAIPLEAAIPLATVAGLFVGSFLNVVVYRTPLGLSVANPPRSFCPSCKRQLQWWENIPVASWIVLRRRCRTCSQPISARYPAVELATGAIFALVTWGWHDTIVAAAYCALAATMVAVSLIEYSGLRAPLAIAGTGTAIAQLIILVGAGWQGHWRIVGGSLIGTAIGLALIVILRSRDPECLDPRGFGRSALLITGCWLGGLGLYPIAVGIGTWALSYFVGIVANWSGTPQNAGAGGRRVTSNRIAAMISGTPLVFALAGAMVASLIAAR